MRDGANAPYSTVRNPLIAGTAPVSRCSARLFSLGTGPPGEHEDDQCGEFHQSGAMGSTNTMENDQGLASSTKRTPLRRSPFLGKPVPT